MNQDLSRLSLMLVGCGAMGSALLKAWLQDQTLFKSIVVVSPHRVHEDSRVRWFSEPEKVDIQPDIILFAVKPQVLPKILPLYKRFMNGNPLFLSIVAGIARSYYEAALPDVRLIRIMPNLPVVVLKGMSALCANATATAVDRQLAEFLMQQVGKIVWVEDDQQIDVVTAISGCGPAYAYLLAEALEKGAQELGLEPSQSAVLVQQTIIGAASYLEKTGKTATELRQQVTSPGGMTEAAVASLQQNGLFDKIFIEALKAAMKRAAELRERT